MEGSEYRLIKPIKYDPNASANSVGAESPSLSPPPKKKPPNKKRRRLLLAFFSVAAAAALLALFFSNLKTARFQISPDGASIAIKSSAQLQTYPNGAFIAINDDNNFFLYTGDRYLMSPGAYEAKLAAMGYENELVKFTVDDRDTQVFSWQLHKKPGHLDIDAATETPAKAYLEGELIGTLPLAVNNLAARDYELAVKAPGYAPLRTTITVKGMDLRQQISLTLKKLRFGALEVISRPARAAVNLNGKYQGLAPLTLALEKPKKYRLELLKAGYHVVKRTISSPTPGEKKKLTLTLKRIFGKVYFDLRPASAVVSIDGEKQKLGANNSLRLPASMHKIKISAPGYGPQTHLVRVDEKLEKIVATKLVSNAAVAAAKSKEKEKSVGFEFVDIYPNDSFIMETSRLSRTVHLTRAFAISKKEVSNRQFKSFDKKHNSGMVDSYSLDKGDQPAVNISWEKVALYTNWLSAEAKIAPFYKESKGRIIGFNAQSYGYRLPTEAEWMWAARGDNENKYIWGDKYQPLPAGAGNYADQSAKNLLPATFPTYNDGEPVTAKVGSFNPNYIGLYDLGGNAAEWAHDVFSIGADALRGADPLGITDPLGQVKGDLHVIKGASWRSWSAIDVNLKRRAYGDKGGDYVGFRVARYLPPSP